MSGLDHYVLLLVKTRASFTIYGCSFLSSPNSAVIFRPGTPYQYESSREPYLDDWIHFDCAPSDIPGGNAFPFNRLFPVENIARFTSYLQQIFWEKNYTHPDYRLENTDLLFRVLMNNLLAAYQEHDRLQPYTPYQTRLRALRLKLQSEPYRSYDLMETARHIGISPSYFQHLYSCFFGISFRQDLINMRIAYAKELIRNTSLTIEQIAEQSGYASEVHFYRQFQQKTGLTPSAYRLALDQPVPET